MNPILRKTLIFWLQRFLLITVCVDLLLLTFAWIEDGELSKNDFIYAIVWALIGATLVATFNAFWAYRKECKLVYGDSSNGENFVMKARDALERLKQGNRRFVDEAQETAEPIGKSRRDQLIDSQEPFAIILGCSDSRVPAEIVFDQGLGDLFVIRVAGNIVAPSQIGSIEFAAERFGTRLVVVLGHSQCGAVSATLEELNRPSENRSPNLRSIVDRIRPSVEGLLNTELRNQPEALLAEAVRANIRAATNQLRHGSRILEQLIQQKKLLIVGAEYSLESGEVTFFEDNQID